MKNNKNLIIIAIIFAFAILIFTFLYSNTGLKGFEKKIDNIVLPEGIEKIAIKSAIGDSGGNGNYSTYRVVLVVKTEKEIDELKQKFENNDVTSYYYITNCKDSIFESARNFKLHFDELEKIDDYTDYYFIEFIK